MRVYVSTSGPALRSTAFAKVLARKQWARWLTNFSNEAYYVWLGMRRMALPQAAVPSGESTIAVMRADSRKLVHAGITKPSRLSIADQGALQFRKLWRSIVRRDIVMWVDNWWHAQFRANSVKPNVCLDVTAIAVLHTTPLPHFLGHPSLRDLVDRVDTVAMAFVQQHTEMLKVCTNMCNTPISRRTIRAPLDVAREAGRQQLFCKPFGIYESRIGQNQELLELLDMLRTTQRHCQKPMALLVDCNIHYRVLKFLYSRATIDWNFPDWLRGISLIYGVWHPYKHVCNIIWRKFFPLFSYITTPVFGAGARIYNHPKLIVIEKTIAALLLSAPDIRAQLRQKITQFEGRANQAALNTQDGLRILRGLESHLNYYLPAIFVVGHLVRNCTWAGRADGTGIVATCVLQRCVGLLVDLAGPVAAKMDYVRTICCALLYNTEWHDDTPGAAHVEECCEALLAKLRARCKQHPDKHTADEAGDLFRTMPPRQEARATESLSESVCVEVRDRVWALMRGAGREEHPTVRWSSGPFSVVEAERDTTYVFPEKGTGGTLTVVFMKSILKRFLRTLVGGQGLHDDAMAYIRQHIPLRPPVNRREARAAVETVGFIPIAMEHIIPPVPNAMFIDHVHAPPEDGVRVIRARDAVDVDALCDGPVLVVLSEELREFD